MLKHMNETISYIEENRTGTIDYKIAAGLACCSEYHYKRMFSFLAGIPRSEYIRHRRLTFEAAGPFPETLQDVWEGFISNGSPPQVMNL